jgi:cellulose synthase/poly-beta-1,6-N-acetylglucosamine synthase-like glycosyltransferase
VPHDAFSVVEDLEYGIALGLAGHRVHYVAEAHVYGEMPSGEQASRSQRSRWEAGRARMVRLHAPSLLARGLRTRDRVLLDLAMDLLVPPLATLVVLTVAGLAASLALSWWAGYLLGITWLWIGCLVGLVLYGLRGWQLSGTGARGLLGLCFAPTYVVWKLVLMRRRSANAGGEWVRTAREAGKAP